MPKIAYENIKFRADSLKLITHAVSILEEYARRGIVVTLRQLYYQFVARDIIPNKQSEYKRLGSVINDARLAGLIDWDHLQDRTRNLQSIGHWANPGHIIQGAASSYHRDLWQGQPEYVEVWIEKDALVGVIEGPCERWDVPYFSCRGYTSQSEMWGAAMRLLRRIKNGQTCTVIHLGDHDPSGKDMSRDIRDRIVGFLAHHVGMSRAMDFTLNRIALNMNQIEQYNPPPNPAKLTDSRCAGYIEQYGDESWELDALDPDVLNTLIEEEIQRHLDIDMFEEQRELQETERELLNKAADRWDDVAEFLGEEAA